MGDIMYACCVLHDMILSDRNLLIQEETDAMRDAVDRGQFQVRPSHDNATPLMAFSGKTTLRRAWGNDTDPSLSIRIYAILV